MAIAVEINTSMRESLQARAQRDGFVKVTVTLPTYGQGMPGEALVPADPPSLWEREAALVQAELGPQMFESGYRASAFGTLDFYVTPTGLDTLLQSRSIRALDRSGYHIPVSEDDGSLLAVRALVAQGGSAEVEVFLMSDAADYRIARDGSTVFQPSTALPDEIAAVWQALQASAPVVRSIGAVDRSPSRRGIPAVRAVIDQSALVALQESEQVLAIRPLGFVDRREARWSPTALAATAGDGRAEMSICVRETAVFSLRYRTPQTRARQEVAGRAALDDVLRPTGAALRQDSDFSVHCGSLFMNREQLQRLYAAKDPRVMWVQENTPVTSAL